MERKLLGIYGLQKDQRSELQYIEGQPCFDDLVFRIQISGPEVLEREILRMYLSDNLGNSKCINILIENNEAQFVLGSYISSFDESLPLVFDYGLYSIQIEALKEMTVELSVFNVEQVS